MTALFNSSMSQLVEVPFVFARMDIAARSLSHAKLPSCTTTHLFQFKSSPLALVSVTFLSSKTCLTRSVGFKARKLKNLGAIHASEAESTSTDVTDRWLLVPVGDGDTKHIGFKVQMPNAFEIVSNEVTIGRLPDKADVVIPVVTVSGVHARIQKKGGSLLVTDLDSTNGTFVDDKQLRPGVITTVSSGSRITFGDIHLAMFRVSKIEKVEAKSTPEKSKDKPPAESPSESNETS